MWKEADVADALSYAVQLLNEWVVVNRALEIYHKRRFQSVAEQSAKAESASRTNAGAPWLPEDDARLLRLYKEGNSITAIAACCKRTQGAIQARLAHLGFARRGRDVPEFYDGTGLVDNDELRYRFLHGETIPQLAQRYGRTEKAINARLFYMGIGGSAPKVLPGKEKDEG